MTQHIDNKKEETLQPNSFHHSLLPKYANI